MEQSKKLDITLIFNQLDQQKARDRDLSGLADIRSATRPSSYTVQLAMDFDNLGCYGPEFVVHASVEELGMDILNVLYKEACQDKRAKLEPGDMFVLFADRVPSRSQIGVITENNRVALCVVDKIEKVVVYL